MSMKVNYENIDYEVEIENTFINHDYDEIDDDNDLDESEYESDIEFE